MDEEARKSEGALSADLNTRLKIFLASKPGGYQYIRKFVRDAVEEKMARMKGTQ